MKTQISIVVCAALLAGCTGETKNDANTEVASEVKEATCVYSYDATTANPTLSWVSYKFTEKKGVKGAFDEIELSELGSGEKPSDVLMGAKMHINTASVNSGDATRDPKIKDAFFGSMEGGNEINGVIAEVSGDEFKGELTAMITMNGIAAKTPGTYEMQENHIDIHFNINMSAWSANPSLDALNKVCEDLHKGEDGKSILWPEVDVTASAELTKTCN